MTPEEFVSRGRAAQEAIDQALAKLPPQLCPNCAHPSTEATCLNADVRPQPGDVTLCISCGAPLRFGSRMEFLPLGPKDLAALPAGQRRFVADVQAAIRELRRRRGLRVENQ